MAYMSQEKKAKLVPAIKAICKKYGISHSVSVNNHSTLVVTIKKGPIDFIENFIETESIPSMDMRQIQNLRKQKALDVNPYWYKQHYSGKALEFLSELIPAMNDGNHDRSDIMTDYFDVGWYITVHIGRWNKPYRATPVPSVV